MSSESLNYFHTGAFVSYMVYRLYTVTCAFQTEMSWVFAVYKSLKETLIISDTCKTHQNNLYLKMGKSRLEQCQSTKELKYETILRPLCGNSSELLLFEFTGFLGHVLIFKGCRPCRRPRKNGQVTKPISKPNGHLTCLASLLQVTPVGWWVYVDGILRRDQLASQHRKSFCPCWLTIRFQTFETKLLCYMTVISYIIWWSEFFPTIGRQFPAFSYFRDPTSQHHVLLILE